MKEGRPVIFGEALFDRFADGQLVLGGAPFNVAWNLHAFGVSPTLITRVGNDELGRQLLAVMRGWGMDSAGVQIDADHATGVVDVTLKGTEPQYDIVADRAYDFIDREQLPILDEVGILYHGSLACRGRVSRATLQHLKTRLDADCFVDINLRPPHYSREELPALIQDATWLKLNEAEFSELSLVGSELVPDVRKFLVRYNLKHVVITRAEKGAEVVSSGAEPVQVSPGSVIRVVDSVGAGDAFSSVLLLGLLKGWPIRTTVQRASTFAGAVLGLRGATIDDPDFYRKFLDTWELE